MEDLRSLFASVRLAVVGDLMLDEYLYGTVNRISPEAPVPVVDIRTRRYVPGGAGNVAANVRSLGAEVRLVGVCGKDHAAEVLGASLAKLEISDTYLVCSHSRATTCKTRVIGGHQQIVRFDSEQRMALSSGDARLLQEKYLSALCDSSLCIFSDYGKGVLTGEFCRRAIELAQARNCRVIVDPKGTDYAKYRGCTLLTPNLREAAEASGIAIETEDDLNQAGNRLLEILDGSSILITRGPDGMTLFRPHTAPLTIPTVAREVFDVVGAGDTAVAVLGVSIAAGLTLESGTRLANVAAGIAVARQGTVAVSIDDLLVHPETRQMAQGA
jgi:rfaE bifunctional protein kinase chain/domain